MEPQAASGTRQYQPRTTEVGSCYRPPCRSGLLICSSLRALTNYMLQDDGYKPSSYYATKRRSAKHLCIALSLQLLGTLTLTQLVLRLATFLLMPPGLWTCGESEVR